MNRDFDRLRRTATPLENAVVDELIAGRLDRRGFLRHARRIGMAAPLIGALGFSRTALAEPKRGGTIRVGMTVPAGAVNPLTVADAGGVALLSQAGEYLAVSDPDLMLRPMLAESWGPNEDGSVWTFTIRAGVKFHDGRTMTAADVAATMNRLADPANGSVALSVFAGVLSKGGAVATDEHTVAFHLDAPNGNFPYLVSSDNYNAIILPADYGGDFEKSFNGTGPFRLERFVPRARASFVRKDDYWRGQALPDRTVFIFYDGIQAQVLAMQGGQLDALLHVPVQGSQALLVDPGLNVVPLKSSAHEQLHMRTDAGPFADKRVRQALALCLNRDNLVTGLFRGMAAPGNDSPFAPAFPSTDTGVPQRKQDIAQARELLAAAGIPNGFDVTLTTERFIEIPDYAVVVQNAAREIGIRISLNVEDQSSYYGYATFGRSDWLDSVLGIEDYAHRGVPNTLLTASLGSKGAFNAAHFKNAEYDRLGAGYIAALDPAAQRDAAGRIQRLLLDETPVITAYFYDWLSITSKRITGVRPTAAGQLFLDKAGFA
ncbi:MAG TPA: ABC transporter substrate-binding protein [Alphaproteobacteria bacterium]|jgi:peptide/nickel transport system substrate-binding protein|nr:ABC transporter substrate-binding protein [Alphaproteobacteria bacterium]